MKVLCLLGSLLLISGCDKAFFTAADFYYNSVGEDYLEYVRGDDSLDDQEKDSRIIAHEMFGNAIATERSRLDGGGG